jgi:hypothetical protein
MQAMRQQLIPTTELSFKKQIISIDAHWSHKNVVIYEINKDDKNIATIEINSIFTAKINYNSKTYLIRPKTKFVFIKKLEIFSSEDVKIGEIDYYGNLIKMVLLGIEVTITLLLLSQKKIQLLMKLNFITL